MRTTRLLPAILLVSAFLPGCGGRAAAEPSQPNIFLISIDTLRADHLGIYGYERDTSPFLDQLATEGTFVQQAVVATHGTTPSHASMLTSLPQEIHGVGLTGRIDDVVPASLLNLPEVLHDAGYTTIAVTGGGNVGRGFGFDRGFDVFDDRARGVEQGRSRLLDHLAAAPADQPLFVFFHTYEVHSPYDPPAELLGRYGPTDSSFSTTSDNLLKFATNATLVAPKDLAHIRARYDEGIRYADGVLRNLFEDLGQRGLFEDALVLITSDHGEEFGEHGGLLHRDTLYEELLRVPLILWGPRVPKGGRAPAAALSLDLAPTLVSCAGLPIPESWFGHDLLCSPNPTPTLLVSQYGNRRYGVSTPEWKLLVTPTATGNILELYDLVRDQAETKNVAESHPEVVERLVSELRRWRIGLTTAQSNAGPADLSDEERKQLEALGYLGHDSDS